MTLTRRLASLASAPDDYLDLAEDLIESLQHPDQRSEARRVAVGLVTRCRQSVLDWIGTGNDSALWALSEGVVRLLGRNRLGAPLRSLSNEERLAAHLLGVVGIAEHYRHQNNGARYASDVLGVRRRSWRRLMLWAYDVARAFTVEEAAEATLDGETVFATDTERGSARTARDVLNKLVKRGLFTKDASSRPMTYKLSLRGRMACAAIDPSIRTRRDRDELIVELFETVRTGTPGARLMALDSIATVDRDKLPLAIELAVELEGSDVIRRKSLADRLRAQTEMATVGATPMLRWVWNRLDDGRDVPEWVWAPFQREHFESTVGESTDGSLVLLRALAVVQRRGVEAPEIKAVARLTTADGVSETWVDRVLQQLHDDDVRRQGLKAGRSSWGVVLTAEPNVMEIQTYALAETELEGAFRSYTARTEVKTAAPVDVSQSEGRRVVKRLVERGFAEVPSYPDRELAHAE